MNKITDIDEKRKKTKEEVELEKIKKYFEENQTDLLKAYYSLKQQENSSYYDYSEKGKITSFLVKKFIPQYLGDKKFISFTDELYQYDNGVYRKAINHMKEIQEMLSISDPQIVRNVKNASIALKTKLEVDISKINENNDFINFKNGIYDVKKDVLIEHNPDIYSTIQVKGNFSKYDNDKFDQSMFKKYMDTSFEDYDYNTIQEIFGYCLTGYVQAQKMFFFLGEGRNGKGVLLRLIDSLYTEEFKSSVRLEQMFNDDRLAQLFGKYINIAGDISAKYIEDDSLIKSIVGEDPITGSKKFKDTFRFINKAKFIFSGQKMPGTAGKEFAFIERLIIIKCNKVIPVEKRITGLSEILINKEFDVIISWAIEGLKRLLKNDFKFTISEAGKNNIKEYDYENNSLKQFIETYCNLDTSDKSFIPKSEFTKVYEQFCKIEGLKPLMAKTRIKTMEEFKITEKHTVLFNGRYWVKIAWNKLVEEIFKELAIKNDGTIDNEYIKNERNALEHGL